MLRFKMEHFLPPATLPAGFRYPEAYCAIVSRDPMRMGLTPWNYTSQLAAKAEYYSARVGERLVPFAQAYGWDELAFFAAVDSSDPPVVIVGLTPEDLMRPVRRRLRNFVEWLDKAHKDAEQYQKEHED